MKQRGSTSLQIEILCNASVKMAAPPRVAITITLQNKLKPNTIVVCSAITSKHNRTNKYNPKKTYVNVTLSINITNCRSRCKNHYSVIYWSPFSELVLMEKKKKTPKPHWLYKASMQIRVNKFDGFTWYSQWTIWKTCSKWVT